MKSENLVLPEADFVAFQRFCRLKGFDLCYFGPEISLSDIKGYRLDDDKVVKVERRRFSSVCIPYEVAEWQRREWQAALPRLKAKFFEARGGVKMVDDKTSKPDNISKMRAWVESWTFFRLAATSMAAGILLVLVPSSGAGLPLIGFIMFWFSTTCLLAELSRFSERCNRLREWVSLYGNALTPVFILVSIASVIFNWAKVVTLLQGGTQVSVLPICDWTQWFQWFYSKALPWWLVFFGFILLVSTVKTLRARVVGAKEHPLRMASKQIGSILVLAAGLFGIYRLQSANLGCNKDVWVILSVVLTVVVFYYLSKDKKPDK